MVGRAAARGRAGARGAPADRRRRRGPRAGRARGRRPAGRRACRRRPRSPRSARPTRTRARRTRGARRTPTSSAASHGRFDFPPDVVARPRGERDVEAVLEWAADANVAVVPYGGGTSVTGGVQCEVPARFDGAVSLDMGAMDRVLQIDDVSRAALIQAGASGPALEKQLRALDLTLRFYPQSFELSTLGGWIATRAGGHFATVETHIDDLVESVRALTPSGAWESRRLPGSGAGPSPDRMLLGSEGILGVITEAWVRVRPRPQAHSLAAVRFADFSARHRGAASDRAVRPAAVQLPPDRRRGGAHDRRQRRQLGAARARLRGRRRGAAAGRRAARPGAAAVRRGGRRVGRGRGAAAAGGGRRRRARATPSAPGGRRFCARRTCATRSSRWGSCRRRSRPRSRGSASARCTPPSAPRPARRSGRRAA